MTKAYRFKLTKIEDALQMDMYLRYLAQLRGQSACSDGFSSSRQKSAAYAYRPCHSLPVAKKKQPAGSLFKNTSSL